MRNLVIIFTIILLFIACSSTKSQNTQKTRVSFENQLSVILKKIDNAKNIQDIFENINKLKRLSTLYPKEWLSDYYISFLDIKLSMGIEDKKKKEILLNEAKETLKRLKEKENIIESEIVTLEGYYHYALIAKNPRKNGQLYYNYVIEAYQKAIKIDEDNPRPLLMLSIFQKMMSKFIGKKDPDFCNNLSKVEKLLENSAPKNKVYPNWGAKRLKIHKKTYCN